MPKVKGKRIAAAIIDRIIVFFVTSIFTSIVAVFSYQITSINHLAVFIIPISTILIIFFYFSVIPYVTKGYTLAKAILRIKVVTLDYQAPKFSQYLLRNIFFIEFLFLYSIPMVLSSRGFSRIIIIFLGGFAFFVIDLVILVMIAVTDDERGFHDLIARTCVIDSNFSTDPLNKINIIEKEQMDWAIFESEDIIPNSKEATYKKEEDEIEILKRID